MYRDVILLTQYGACQFAENMYSVVGFQFVKGNHDHNEKRLDIGLDQAPSIPGCIQSDGNRQLHDLIILYSGCDVT